MNGTRGLVIAMAGAFIVGCSVGLMGGILFARFALHPSFMRFRLDAPRGFFAPGHTGGRERLLPMLEETLKLTPEQRERIVAILDRARASGAAIHDSMEVEITRVLDPDQRARWKEMEQGFERSRRMRFRRIAWPPDDSPPPCPGERNDPMRSNLWISSLTVALAAMPMAPAAYAAEAPAAGTAEIAPGRGADVEREGDDGFELDWLAADLQADPGAGGGPGMMMRHGGPGDLRGRMGEMGERLNLTDDQRSRLADIRDRHQRTIIPIQADLKIAALDLRKLMRADRPDNRAINAQIDKIAGLRASIQKAHVSGMLEARAVLTPAQQKMLREHHGPMMRRMGGPGPRMMHMGVTQ